MPITAEFVILPLTVATSLARLWEAVSLATWGDLRARYPDIYAEACELGGYAQTSEGWESTGLLAPPEDDDTFDVGEMSLVNADGEWPPSPRVLMYQHLPRGLPERFGITYPTELDQMAVEFTEEQGQAIIAELEALGLRCVEDRELIDAIAQHELQQWGPS